MQRMHIVGILSAAPEKDNAQRLAIAERLLAREATPLQHNGFFVGRPTTRVHADDAWVLKLREEHHFGSRELALAWANKRLEAERRYGVHHPARTWLVVETPRGWAAANLAPRLAPLHMHDWAADAAPAERLADIVRLYLRFWRAHGQRLDEGLSNFGLDAAGRLFYLDDDFFPADEHRSFVAMLGQWLRLFGRDWLGEAEARLLGKAVREALRDARPIELRLVVEALRELFLPAFAERQRQALLAALTVKEDAFQGLDWHQPVGVIADIHGNLAALEVALNVLTMHGVRQFLCLGDVVGYGPHPRACIARVRELGMPCIMGNHDYYVAHGAPARVAMSRTARRAAEWTRAQLSENDLEWLAGLPLKHEGEVQGRRVLALHGAPVDRTYFNAYVYEQTWERNLDWMREHGVWLCLHGHSHLQGGYWEDEDGSRGRAFGEAGLSFAGRAHLLLNPGAVGQPRDGRPGAQAAIVTPEGMRWLCLEYDLAAVARDIRAQGLPPELAERLLQGR